MADRASHRSVTISRTIGALALLLIGSIHYQQYRFAFYSAVPTIGPLFLANFFGATALGFCLLAPGKSRLGALGLPLDRLTALAGAGLAASALVALLISEHEPLFGFMEHGYRFVIVLTISSEIVAIGSLLLFVFKTRTRPRPASRHTPSKAALPS